MPKKIQLHNRSRPHKPTNHISSFLADSSKPRVGFAGLDCISEGYLSDISTLTEYSRTGSQKMAHKEVEKGSKNGLDCNDVCSISLLPSDDRPDVQVLGADQLVMVVVFYLPPAAVRPFGCLETPFASPDGHRPDLLRRIRGQ
ncbi:unnamed protein product [Soboliphyme baturini]|uniref:Uncharacterized protein n=1 Tax=Soboliphyme baturini TaxID=241478 RepID=A0A183JAC7_9BILA|nr:unnamed protein product [Soboliphyme baturini]